MKMMLRLSIFLNLLLAGGLVFLAISQRKESALPAAKEIITPGAVAASPVSPQPAAQPPPFRWEQLDSGNDYRLFIANLRAIGCPENTIEDIVRGNVSRAFAWERSRQKMDGSGNGPWSEANELTLVNSLLGKPSIPSMALSLQNANGQLANPQPVQTVGEPANPAFQTQQNSQDDNNRLADNALQSEVLQFYPWTAQRGNGGAASSVSSAELAIVPGQQDGTGGQIQNPALVQPQNNDPGYDNPIDSSGGKSSSGLNISASANTPVGPPDPLGPNDPYAMSSQDIANLDGQAYDTWYNQQVAAQAGSGTFGLNPGSGPQ